MKIRNMRQSDFSDALNMSHDYYRRYGDKNFPMDFETSYRGLQALHNSRAYLKVMTVDGRVVGWFGARLGTHQPHSVVTGCTQLYYHSTLQGVQAVRALVDFHESFFRYVEKIGYEVAVTSSILPSRSVFERILLKHGWERSDDRLIRWTRHRGKGGVGAT